MSEAFSGRDAPEPAFAGGTPAPTVLLRGERARRGRFWSWTRLERPAPRGLGLVLSACLLAAAVGVGATRGGQYQAFVAQEGGIGDFLARGLGLGVGVVRLTGQSRLTEQEILRLANVTPKDSIPFFDVEAARDRLEQTPLISHASVRKLYPGQLVIDIAERTPAALWQKNGEVRTVAADGKVIDELRNSRLANLPFVVGEGANDRLGEYLGLLDAAGEIAPKIEAGVLVGGRRWNFKMKSGLDVKLPETDPRDAVIRLLGMQRQYRVLDKDLVWLDLRTPGRTFARLSADAAAAREARLAPHAKKGPPQ